MKILAVLGKTKKFELLWEKNRKILLILGYISFFRWRDVLKVLAKFLKNKVQQKNEAYHRTAPVINILGISKKSQEITYKC